MVSLSRLEKFRLFSLVFNVDFREKIFYFVIVLLTRSILSSKSLSFASLQVDLRIHLSVDRFQFGERFLLQPVSCGGGWPSYVDIFRVMMPVN